MGYGGGVTVLWFCGVAGLWYFGVTVLGYFGVLAATSGIGIV